MSNKVVFVVDSLSQPRCIKRILSFANAGYECEVFGYDRNKYNCNTLPDSIKVTVLGEMHDGKDYYKKIAVLRKDIQKIINSQQGQDPLYYSFGFFATILFFLRKKPYIYEISDILYGYPKFSKIMGLLKSLDKKLIKRSIITVMTSEGFRDFLDVHYENIVIQPNKVNAKLLNFDRYPLEVSESDGLVFSFVGAIRYDTIFKFAEIIGSMFPQHEFHFYGQASGRSLERCNNLSSKYANVKYFGAFKNPDDLDSIYKNIDVVVACYTPTSLNEKIAEPNKLYESMFFCKPIVVSDGLFLSKQVQRYQCGYCIDATVEQNIVDFVKHLSVEHINRISQKEFDMNSTELVDDPKEIIKKVQVYYNQKLNNEFKQ